MDKDYGPLKDATATAVLNWAKAQPAGTLIGHCGNPDACLIATYADRVLDLTVAICPSTEGGEYWHQEAPFVSVSYDLPESLNRLAIAFDDLGPLYEDVYADEPRLQRLAV